MLLTGYICVDPSEITKIKKIEPKSVFKKFLHTISNGKIRDLLEEENFTAVSIVQQLNKVLNALGIDNIIRLSHNDKDYFLDKLGKEDDLESALNKYEKDIKENSSSGFKSISLVLEHNEDSFHYFIEIKVNKSHKIGEYPIEIKVNGLLNEFYPVNSSKSDLIKKMEHVFRSQDAYDFYGNSKINEFSHFLNMIGDEIKKNIPVDDLIIEYKSAIILPKDRVSSPDAIKVRDYNKEPAFHGYYDSQKRLWYVYIWPEICGEHNIYINKTLIYSDGGNRIGSLDEQGIDSGDSPLFDLNESVDESFESEERINRTEKKQQNQQEDWF